MPTVQCFKVYFSTTVSNVRSIRTLQGLVFPCAFLIDSLNRYLCLCNFHGYTLQVRRIVLVVVMIVRVMVRRGRGR